jgi:ribosomal protein S18 acetylase RimI-like enzyme
MMNSSCYRKLVNLNNGNKVTLRLIDGQDRKALMKLFSETPPEAMRLMKQDALDLDKLGDWLDHLTWSQLMPLIAVGLEDTQPIGTAFLRRGQHTASHVGEIEEVFVSRHFQGIGLGSRMLEELIIIAQKLNLQWLKAEVAVEQKNAVKAFEAKGFSIKTCLEDFLISKDGVTHDVVLMTRAVSKGDPKDPEPSG